MTKQGPPSYASGLSDEVLNKVGRRLAAAFLSYLEGRKGVDSTLKKAPERVGRFWRELADLIYVAKGMRVEQEPDLMLRDVITKMIQ
jgi:hypothetical protein